MRAEWRAIAHADAVASPGAGIRGRSISRFVTPPLCAAARPAPTAAGLGTGPEIRAATRSPHRIRIRLRTIRNPASLDKEDFPAFAVGC